jgi:flagellar assembly protein FliH
MSIASNAVVVPMEYLPMGSVSHGESLSLTIFEHGVRQQASDHGELEMRIAELEAELEKLTQRVQQEQAAQQEFYEKGKQEQQREHLQVVEMVSGHLMEAIRQFHTVRDHYLAQVEREVVHLSLAIASRILHREVRMDPLLLSGVVRVALGQLSDATEVRLRVPAPDEAMWREMLRLMPNLPLHPEVIADEKMHTGECALETRLGSIDLGVSAQLAEIERGFFDLLEHRTKVLYEPVQ